MIDNSGRKLAIDAVWSLALKIFGATSNLLVLLILARSLSESYTGEFIVAQSLAILVAMICRFGMKQPVVKLVAEALENRHFEQLIPIIKSVLILVSIGSVTMALFMALGGASYLFTNVFSYNELYNTAWIWIAVVIVLAFQTPIAEAFRGMQNAREAILFDGPLANFLFLVVLVVLKISPVKLDFSMALILYCSCTGISLAVSACLLCQNLSKYKSGENAYPLREVAIMGLPVFIINISAYVVSQAGLWICGVYLLTESAAHFGAALRLMLVVSLPLFILNLVIQPIIVSLYVADKKILLERKVRQATTLATAVSIGVTAFILIWPAQIMVILFGPGYQSASLVLCVLTVGQLVNVAVGPCLNFMLLVGRRGLATVIVLFSGVVSISLSLALVGTYGIAGVAIGSAAGIAIQNCCLCLAAKQLSNVSTLTFIRPADIYQTIALISTRRLTKGV